MGRGRKGVINQRNKKNIKRSGNIPIKDSQLMICGIKPAGKQTFDGFPEDFLNDLRQMNPRELANILVNMQI